MDVEKLRELERRATPGPWVDPKPDAPYGAVVSSAPTGDPMTDDERCVEAYGGHLIGESLLPANRALIVALRNAAPEILARLEKLERIAEQASQLNVSMKLNLPDDKYGEVEQDRRYLERELNALADLDGGKPS